MKDDIEFTTLDISKFYYERDIVLSDRIRISKEIWNSKNSYVEILVYESKKKFIKEIEEMLNNIIFRKKLNKEKLCVNIIQKELDLEYDEFNSNDFKPVLGQDFLKQVRLRLDFETKREFVYMKIRTLLKNYGYKRRSDKFIEQLKNDLNALDLYIVIKERKVCDIDDLIHIKLDDTIRIYSYGNFTL